MDPVTSVTVFSHILNIKEKLFPNKTESASTELGVDGKEIDKSKYCSLFGVLKKEMKLVSVTH